VRKPYVARPYGATMTGHLLEHPRCALWAGMGLGKTVTTLTALDALYLSGESHPTLILAPLRVARKTWSEEIAKWDHLSGLDATPIIGAEKERLAALRKDTPIYTTNYDNLEWLVEHWGDRWPYQVVVSDESTRLKSLRLSFRTSSKGKEFVAGQGGKRARALGKIAHSHIKRFIQLTGTPSPNGLTDLWGQLWFLDGGKRLGRTFDSFKQRWFQTSFDGYGYKPLPYAQEQIHNALRDICLTIDGKDWFDLKEPVCNTIYVDLPPKARQIYRDMEKQMFAEIGDRTAEAFGAAARTQKCMQIASGAAYVDPEADSDASPRAKDWRHVHDAKLDALESVIEEANGAAVLVSYQFRSDLARLLKAFPEGRALSEPENEEAFKAGEIQIGFVHPRSMGHGVDGFQHVCNILVFFGHDWNLEEYQQIIERIGPVRQMQAGLDRPVFLHHIVARDTVDELVMERRASKREVQDILLDAMKRR